MTRVFSSFSERMEFSRSDKERMCKYIQPGKILDFGVGTGCYLPAIIASHSTSDIYCVDKDLETLKVVKNKHPKIKAIHCNILSSDLHEILPTDFDTIIFSSVLHEIEYPFGRKYTQETLSKAATLLRKGGSLIVRDGVKPDNKNKFYDFILKSNFAKTRFPKFVREYKVRKVQYEILNKEKDLIRISKIDLHDFICKYYFEGDLWGRDMNETFGVMTPDDYLNVLCEYFSVDHIEQYIAPYLNKMWNEDFVFISKDSIFSHILCAAQKK